MASNEEWVVPASLEARRFFVLDVSNEKVGHYDYFKAIQDELDAGGYGAMLHDLLKVGLANFKVAAVPQTEGLATQKKLSLKTHEQWWLDVLQRGYVWKSKFGLEEDFHVWHEDTATDLFVHRISRIRAQRGGPLPAQSRALWAVCGTNRKEATIHS